MISKVNKAWSRGETCQSSQDATMIGALLLSVAKARTDSVGELDKFKIHQNPIAKPLLYIILICFYGLQMKLTTQSKHEFQPLKTVL